MVNMLYKTSRRIILRLKIEHVKKSFSLVDVPERIIYGTRAGRSGRSLIQYLKRSKSGGQKLANQEDIGTTHDTKTIDSMNKYKNEQSEGY
jgi:hypothetical protein